MLPIEVIRERINHLRELENIADISNEIKKIFYDIIYCGDKLFLIIEDGQPYCKSLNDTGRFLRIYTHEDLAKCYIEKRDGLNILSVSVVESIQLAKTFFLKGGNGFILNEGDKWISISFADYLELFFQRIKSEEDMFNRKCANVISLLNEITFNNNFVALMNNKELANIDGYCYVFSKDIDNTEFIKEGGEFSLQPLGISDLFDLTSDLYVITTDDKVSYAKSLIFDALSYCGYDESSDLAFIEQKPFKESEADWHTTDISLNFYKKDSIEEVVDDSAIEEETEDIAFTDNVQEKEDVLEEISQQLSLKERFNNNVLLSIKHKVSLLQNKMTDRKHNRWLFFKKKDSAIQITDLENNDDIKIDKKSSDNMEENPCDNIEQSKHSHRINKFKLKPKMSMKKSIIALFVLAILGCIGVSLIQYNNYNRAYESFCSFIDSSDYGNAYAIYNEENLHAKADEYIKDNLNKKLLSYANDEISIEALKASMQSLANFPTMQQELEVARLTATKLENSKNAYKAGVDAASIYDKLDNWRQVIELDAINYAVVQDDVKQNQLDYESELKKDIEYYSTRIRDYAKARYEVLVYWYPESDVADEWFGKFQSDNTSLLSIYPIVIYDIDVNQSVDSYWNLKISWKNKSVKTIQSIRFSLVAVDEQGNIMVCSDYQGSWTVFDALDPHRYEPGDGSFDKDYRWSKAFYGSLLADVRLTGVYIEYADGSTASYTNETELANMQEQQ